MARRQPPQTVRNGPKPWEPSPQQLEIYALVIEGELTQAEIAKRFGIAQSTIRLLPRELLCQLFYFGEMGVQLIALHSRFGFITDLDKQCGVGAVLFFAVPLERGKHFFAIRYRSGPVVILEHPVRGLDEPENIASCFNRCHRLRVSRIDGLGTATAARVEQRHTQQHEIMEPMALSHNS